MASGAIENLPYNLMNAVHASYSSLAAFCVCSCLGVNLLLVTSARLPNFVVNHSCLWKSASKRTIVMQGFSSALPHGFSHDLEITARLCNVGVAVLYAFLG